MNTLTPTLHACAMPQMKMQVQVQMQAMGRRNGQPC